jgi:hypothetical protein
MPFHPKSTARKRTPALNASDDNISQLKESQMSANNTSEAILIRENARLPAGFEVQTEVFLPGWRAVKNIDVYGLGRKIEEANWNFFFLAGEIRAIAFGSEEPVTLRRAAKQILAKREEQMFNCLEITEVRAKRFLGIPYLTVVAHSRHIQESPYLIPERDLAARMPVTVALGTELDDGEREDHTEVLTKQHPALISTS